MVLAPLSAESSHALRRAGAVPTVQAHEGRVRRRYGGPGSSTLPSGTIRAKFRDMSSVNPGSPMLDRLRSRLPQSLKRPVRLLLDVVDERRRARQLAHGIAALRGQARTGRVPASLIADLHAAWGNTGWSADAGFVIELANRTLASPGPFLDCGSGLSTIVAGVIAEQRGARVWSLEQDPAWYEHMRGALAAHDVLSVDLRHAALRTHGGYAWFDIDRRHLPGRFTQIYCDGPAVLPEEWPEPQYSNWRGGVVPILGSLGIAFDEILLDDAEDPRCAILRERWAALDVETEIVSTATGSYVIGRPRRPEQQPAAGRDS